MQGGNPGAPPDRPAAATRPSQAARRRSPSAPTGRTDDGSGIAARKSETLRRPAFVAAAAVAQLLAGQAHALVLTNLDDYEWRISIIEPDRTIDRVIEPDERVNGLCESGCTIMLQDGTEAEFGGNEAVYIRNGRFVLLE